MLHILFGHVCIAWTLSSLSCHACMGSHRSRECWAIEIALGCGAWVQWFPQKSQKHGNLQMEKDEMMALPSSRLVRLEWFQVRSHGKVFQHVPGIWSSMKFHKKQRCLDLSERPKHAPFRGAFLLRCFRFDKLEDVSICFQWYSLIQWYWLCKGSYTSVPVFCVCNRGCPELYLGGALPKRAVFRCGKLNLSVAPRTEKTGTLLGTNISHLEKRKIIFNHTLGGDMLVPRRVRICSISWKWQELFCTIFGTRKRTQAHTVLYII